MMEKALATLTVKDAGEMSDEERKQIAEWLRLRASDLVLNGYNYSKRFRGRYLVQVPE